MRQLIDFHYPKVEYAITYPITATKRHNGEKYLVSALPNLVSFTFLKNPACLKSPMLLIKNKVGILQLLTNYKSELDIKSLRPGLDFVRLLNSDQTSRVMKFVKQ